MIGRIARVIDVDDVIASSLKRFPQNKQEIIRAKEWADKLAENQFRENAYLQQQGQQLKPQNINPPQVLLEPGVWYSQQWLPNKLKPGIRPDGLPEGKWVDFVAYDKVPMGDWDFPDAIHDPNSVSIQSLGDVYDKLVEYTAKNPQSSWQTYLTPGGVRAFEMSQQMSPRGFANKGYTSREAPPSRFKELNIDPAYASIAVNKPIPGNYPNIPRTREIYPRESYSARISGKPGREEDFVAYPLGAIGQGRPDARNQRLIREYHDIPIMRSMAMDGMTPGILPPTGLDLLEWHLASVPRQYREPIEIKLERMGII